MTLLEKLREGMPLDIGVIDMHGHTGRVHWPIPELGIDKLIRAMDLLGVKTFFTSSCSVGTSNIEFANDETLAAVTACPDRIKGYVGIFPRSRKMTLALMEKYLAAGFNGLKLHNYNGFSYLADAYVPAYEICDDLALPILFHTWGGRELDEIRDVAKRYSNVPVLAGHAGAANETAYVELAKTCANVYLELAFSGAYCGLVRRFVEAVGAERIVWGSDAISFNMAQQIGKVVGAKISEEEKILILSTNAQRIIDGIKK